MGEVGTKLILDCGDTSPLWRPDGKAGKVHFERWLHSRNVLEKRRHAGALQGNQIPPHPLFITPSKLLISNHSPRPVPPHHPRLFARQDLRQVFRTRPRPVRFASRLHREFSINLRQKFLRHFPAFTGGVKATAGSPKNFLAAENYSAETLAVNPSAFFVSHFRFLPLGITLLAGNFSIFAQGYKPSEAVQKMSVADGFKVELVASEPMIAQPVGIEFDDRGRLWVIQYLQYPNPAGLNRAKVDRFSRTTYDKIPDPPPRGPKGADRITILERVESAAEILSEEKRDAANEDPSKSKSAKSDATSAERISAAHYQSKDFISGLNLASGLAFGHGGVFVVQVPYLLFYPDKNHDDIPDSDPEVLLTGFGMEDAHSVANSLAWGPDGWLYGCQGSTVTANIRGIEFQQGVWRYHPLSKRFELFCEGGGNSWGLDFDEDGNLIYSTNLGPNRNLHGVQGGYYWKSFGKHGELHNPYAYGYFDHIPYKNFTGGHVTDGGIIYQGDSFPEKFRGKYIANDLLGHTVQVHNMEKFGSTFTASYGGELLNPNDTWFAPTDLTMGPDGALYVADWFDKRTAHPDPDAEWDRSNGRIYRVAADVRRRISKTEIVGADVRRLTSNPETNQSLLTSAPTKDLTKLSSAQLIELLSSKNDWFVRKARRVLADRRDAATFPKLRAQIFETKDEHLALESFWALYASGGADESFLNDALEHSSPKIRYWAVRFLGDEEKISPTSCENLLKVAAHETDVRVRSQLASAAKRLPAKMGLVLAQKVALRNLDATDPHIPLLLWWAVENHSVAAVDETVNLFTSSEAWQSALIREIILPRLMRRYAADASEKTLAACARLLETSPDKVRQLMLVALEQGFREQPNAQRISTLEKLPPTLQKQLTSQWSDATKNETVLRLLSRLGDGPAWNRALTLAEDTKSPTELRVAMLQLIGDSANPAALKVLLRLGALSQPEVIQLAALDAIQQIPNAEIDGLLLNYPAMTPRVRGKARDVFLSRRLWATPFLKGVDSGRFNASELPLDQLQKVATLDDNELDALVRKHWGNIGRGTPEEKLADIRRFNNDLRAFPGDAKNGREVFLKTCAQCHELFGEGEKVGPELTHANRADKDFLLTSIVDPNAVIRKEFLNYNVETSDGRILNGLIAEQNANGVTLVAAKNERTIINRDKIISMRQSGISLMPEGLMHGLTPQERRDLFAYLQSEKPIKGARNIAPQNSTQSNALRSGALE